MQEAVVETPEISAKVKHGLELLRKSCLGKWNCYLVGGAWRSLALGREPHDLDIVVDTDDRWAVEAVSRQFCLDNCATWVPLDRERGYYRCVFKERGEEWDFCTRFGGSIEEDLSNRDFTINALAYSLEQDCFVDIYNSIYDLKNRLLRLAGQDCFKKDPLRVLRALRLIISEGWQPASGMKELLRAAIPMLAKVAGERISAELMRIFECPVSSHWPFLEDCGFLDWDLWGGMKDGSLIHERLRYFEQEKQEGWPSFSHSRVYLQSELDKRLKGGFTMFALCKIGWLASSVPVADLAAHLKLSGQEAVALRELRNNTRELLELVKHNSDPGQFYLFVHKKRYFPMLAANAWVIGKTMESIDVEGTYPLASKEEKRGVVDAFEGLAVALDTLLLDCFEGGRIFNPVVPLNGLDLQQLFGMGRKAEFSGWLESLAVRACRENLTRAQAFDLVKSWAGQS